MINRVLLLVVSLLFLLGATWAQETAKVKGRVVDESGESIAFALVSIDSIYKVQAGLEGEYVFENIPYGEHTIYVFQNFEKPYMSPLLVDQPIVEYNVGLIADAILIDTVDLVFSEYNDFGFKRMDAVDHHTITEGKKTEVIKLDEMVINSSTNNAREGYSKISGANIYNRKKRRRETGKATGH